MRERKKTSPLPLSPLAAIFHADEKARTTTGAPAGFKLPLLLCRPAKSKILSDCPLYPDLQYIEIIINGAVRPDQRRCVAPSKAAPFGTPHQVGGVTCRSDAYIEALLRSTPLLYIKGRYTNIFVKKLTMKTRVFTNKASGLQLSRNLLPSGLQLATNPLFAMADHLSARGQSILSMLLDCYDNSFVLLGLPRVERPVTHYKMPCAYPTSPEQSLSKRSRPSRLLPGFHTMQQWQLFDLRL